MLFAIVVIVADKHMDVIGAIRNIVVHIVYNLLHGVILGVGDFPAGQMNYSVVVAHLGSIWFFVEQ